MENYNVDKSIAELYLSTCKERASALLDVLEEKGEVSEELEEKIFVLTRLLPAFFHRNSV